MKQDAANEGVNSLHEEHGIDLPVATGPDFVSFGGDLS